MTATDVAAEAVAVAPVAGAPVAGDPLPPAHAAARSARIAMEPMLRVIVALRDASAHSLLRFSMHACHH
jgi:hypothetical protein